MTTTRRMVYAQIANAVLAGLPEPEEMTFDPATVWLRFDNTDDARLWARWHSPECLASFYTSTTKDGHELACYYGERSDWKWSIVGRDQARSTGVDGNERCHLCGGSRVVEHSTDPNYADRGVVELPCPDCTVPTVEQVTIAALSPDTLPDEPCRCEGCGKTSRIVAHRPGCPVAAAFDERLHTDRLRDCCPRCGHESRGHDEAMVVDNAAWVVCVECPDLRCAPVVVKAATR